MPVDDADPRTTGTNRTKSAQRFILVDEEWKYKRR